MDKLHLTDLKPSLATRQKRRDKRLHEEVIETGRFKNARSARNIKKWNDLGRKKTLQQETALGSVRQRESIRDGRRPCLRDNLEPLERWLAAQVGRPWAAVYSELGRIASPSSMHGAHIRQHLWQYVAQKAWFENDGGLTIALPSGQLQTVHYGYPDFFVHPKTGLFLKSPNDYEAKTEICFPKKARFKMKKQSLKSKIRQGTAQKAPVEKAGTDLKNWPNIRTRIKWAAPGDTLDFLENGNVFRATVVKIGEHESQGPYLNAVRPEWREREWLSLDLKITVVFSGEKFKAGQVANFSVNKNAHADWAAYDEGRLFGNRGLGYKHWAMTRLPKEDGG